MHKYVPKSGKKGFETVKNGENEILKNKNCIFGMYIHCIFVKKGIA